MSSTNMSPAASPSLPAVEFSKVSKSFGGIPVFEDLSFSIRRGEFVCFLGPSGCGKSTTLRLLGGLAGIDGGEIQINGKMPQTGWSELAFVFQSPRLVSWRDARSNVILGMQLRDGGRQTPDRKAKADQLLDLVGLKDDAAKFPRMLSGGERQRVSIARALAVDPDIILMDEPFSALDPNTRSRLRREITDIWKKTGKTIIFVTHDVDEALELADRILMFVKKPTRELIEFKLDQGRPRNVEESESLRAIKRKLVDAYGSTAEENH